MTAHLEQRGLRALYILDYVNALYEPMVDASRAVGAPAPERHLASPRHPDSVAAFAKWAAAAWTLAAPHLVHLTNWQPEISLKLGPLPRYAPLK